MNKKQIDKFFRLVNQNIKDIHKKKIKVILTGAAAGILMGGNRPSIDIDFCIDYDKKYTQDVENALKQASAVTGIAVNFSEDIDRWSQITFLDYRHHTIPYRAFGVIEVSILSPAYWTIGKITRYIDPDIDDLVKVLKNNHVPAGTLAKLWAEALLKSPRSSASFSFKTHVGHFFKTYGPLIWGRGFNPDEPLNIFRKIISP